tara:strand:- start:70 stop:612 length:543 start_codon:yes stop_codon:yes gene_type:complete
MSAFTKSLSPLKEIGAMPKPGYRNPRFWSPTRSSPKVPQGGFTSVIDRGPAFDDADIRRIMNVESMPAAIGSTQSQGKSGSRSLEGMRDAFEGMSQNALGSAQDEFNVKKRMQAEKSYAEDQLGQQQSVVDYFRMIMGAESFGQDTYQRLLQGYKDLAQYVEEEKKNASNRFWSQFLGSF